MTPHRSLTRGTLCKLADMAEERFKSLDRRDQLPMLSAQEYEPPTSGRSWGRYDFRDAMLLAVAERLSQQIGYADGLRPETAVKITGNAEEHLARAWVSPNVWAGYVGNINADGEPEGGGNVGGDLVEIVKRIETWSLSEYGGHPGRAFLVHLSDVARCIRLRAEQENLKRLRDGKAPIEIPETLE